MLEGFLSVTTIGAQVLMNFGILAVLTHGLWDKSTKFWHNEAVLCAKVATITALWGFLRVSQGVLGIQNDAAILAGSLGLVCALGWLLSATSSADIRKTELEQKFATADQMGEHLKFGAGSAEDEKLWEQIFAEEFPHGIEEDEEDLPQRLHGPGGASERISLT